MMVTAGPLDELPGVRHGFFGREGGVSDGIYASLNCGFGSDDSAALVAENRARAAGRLGVTAAQILTLYQTHSPDVTTVTEPWAPEAAPRGDALVTNRPGLALGLLTADCAPVLLADAAAGVVGAAHAGWRGALSGIVEATVAAMQALGATTEGTVAAIGPTIARRSYEVGPGFPQPFLDDDPESERFFVAGARAGHWHFDLAGYVAWRLARAGVARVALLPHDTCADAVQYFSYRRSCHNQEPDYGRNLSAICLVG